MILLVLIIIASVSADLTLVKEGTNHTMTCSFPDAPVLWDFTSTIFPSHETIAYVAPDGRFFTDEPSRYRLERHGRGTKLTVYNVTLRNEGIYTCKKFYDQSYRENSSVQVIGEYCNKQRWRSPRWQSLRQELVS